MSNHKVAVVIFEGGNPVSKIEKDMVRVRRAIVCDTIEKLQLIEEIHPVIVVTNYPELRQEVEQLGACVEFDQSDFHFGKLLRYVIHKHNLKKVFYMGGASAPLITVSELRGFAGQLIEGENLVLTNNVQSADLIAFTPAEAIDRIRLPEADNSLANLLRDVGLEKILMPHSVGIHFDMDTPTDMLVLSIHPQAGKRTRQALTPCMYCKENIETAKHWLSVPYANVALFGRVGSPIITHVNTNVRCRLRVYSEERGMKSLRRDEQNLVKSLIGYLLDYVDLTKFFDYLAQIADVAFIDSRVLFAHKKLHLSDNDRFYSDLFMIDNIQNEWVRAFTQAASEAKLTVVLGGHSSVAGGLWALVDAIQHEATAEYAPSKMYRLRISKDSIFANKRYEEVLRLLPLEAKIYGVTRPLSKECPAYTHIKPSDDLIVRQGYELHVAGDIDVIREVKTML